MRTFDFSPLWRSTVGFDHLADLLDASLRAFLLEMRKPVTSLTGFPATERPHCSIAPRAVHLASLRICLIKPGIGPSKGQP